VIDPENVVKFPAADDQELCRLRAEAEKLADMPEVERTYYLPKRAGAFGVPVKELQNFVRAVLNERARRTAADHLAKDKAERARVAAQEQERRDLDRIRAEERKIAEREKHRQAKEAEREQRKVGKELERKVRLKAKTFGNLARLPVARHADGLAKLAERLGEDAAGLHQEFKDFLGVGSGEASKTEAWPEPVDAAALLRECRDKVRRYVTLQEHQRTAAVLWAAHAWLYDQDVPTHSPMLAATSAEPDSGKSTLVAVLGRVVPRFSLNIEMTGPSLYRHVDAVKPTLVIDEADDLFMRRSDLKHVINAGWTRGAKIARQVNIDGVWVTAYFDPFTPKAISLLGRNLPPATRTRCIEIRMLPKRSDEAVEPFNQLDDEEFAVLRRKFARWAADNAAALKGAKPTLPSGLNNRAAANWHLLLAIAELAGAPWPKLAREAAERLTRGGRRPSDGVRLLAALKAMFAGGVKEITSEKIVENLRGDPTSVWADFNHGGAITQRQVAHLLDAYDVHPAPLHPTGRKDFARRGYRAAQFVDVFARYVPDDPIIRSPQGAGKRKAKLRKRR
jgi:putative DNA primase/helicase